MISYLFWQHGVSSLWPFSIASYKENSKYMDYYFMHVVSRSCADLYNCLLEQMSEEGLKFYHLALDPLHSSSFHNYLAGLIIICRPTRVVALVIFLYGAQLFCFRITDLIHYILLHSPTWRHKKNYPVSTLEQLPWAEHGRSNFPFFSHYAPVFLLPLHITCQHSSLSGMIIT